MSYPLVRSRAARHRLDLPTFARAAGLHPDLVARLVALGLLEPELDRQGRWWFPPAELSTVARIQRLRADMCLNYAALGLVIDLLDRIAELEQALRRQQASRGG